MIERFQITGGRIAEMDITSGKLLVDEPDRYDLGSGFIQPLKSWEANVQVREASLSMAKFTEKHVAVLYVDDRKYSGSGYLMSFTPSGNLKITGTGPLVHSGLGM